MRPAQSHTHNIHNNKQNRCENQTRHWWAVTFPLTIHHLSLTTRNTSRCTCHLLHHHHSITCITSIHPPSPLIESLTLCTSLPPSSLTPHLPSPPVIPACLTLYMSFVPFSNHHSPTTFITHQSSPPSDESTTLTRHTLHLRLSLLFCNVSLYIPHPKSTTFQSSIDL